MLLKEIQLSHSIFRLQNILLKVDNGRFRKGMNEITDGLIFVWQATSMKRPKSTFNSYN